MRFRTLAMAAAIASLFASGATAAERTVTLKVDGMYCGLCGPTVRKSLERVQGVTKVQVDQKKEIATVTFDDATADVPKLIAAATNAGYPARLQN